MVFAETYYYFGDDDPLIGEYRIRHYLTDALKTGACPTGKLKRLISRGMKYGFALLISTKVYLVGIELRYHPYCN